MANSFGTPQKYRNISQLEKLLNNNIVQVFFIKRTDGQPRHMLCTTSRQFLTSHFGLNVLGFRIPQNPPPYPAHAYNLIIVWDIYKRDFRCVCCDDFIVVKVMSFGEFKNKFV